MKVSVFYIECILARSKGFISAIMSLWLGCQNKSIWYFYELYRGNKMDKILKLQSLVKTYVTDLGPVQTCKMDKAIQRIKCGTNIHLLRTDYLE